ncbi:2-hydroxyacid dehydrogenase [Xanthomonas vesicatoria]|uniref:2-hydroxyacid dehydrogenase n=2 Tax=Xanthomonas vesicatoria TaxID=56460 RepID=A0AAJ0N4D9_9XANT|nr:D-glycerate dehydrogenase [Xanthomonas vesicatoria]APO94398.1 D-glycerate dehydrogenase [Xanthomonas vesicatoria]APP74636.1 D-glycerate dehydrogenase [Xanthomonas vesicatoria ATCC 35937]EGD09919.1 lactate dehydrogenase-like oxidoreductase [Xanthomonas vesicatoria ATCC 35937]KHM95076.1 2-hydroxyacid dehydrogenase [Xanthomonas vesicatoria]KHM95370.1 2-hydroxyacid dehydrogenase [Xanthomonas vesicatoria]
MSEATRPKVWVSQPLFDDVVAQLGEYFELTTTERVTAYSSQQLVAHLAGVDGALITLNERVGAVEIASAPQLRAIANVGVGYNNLDIDALSAAGILASNTPDALTETTADLGFALLMATARRITEAERWLRDGQWGQWSFKTLLGADIHGSTLGVLGMGRIGQGIARRGAHGFGMRVLYHNRSRLPAQTEQDLNAQYVDLDSLLAQSDHLVLVLPYTKQSHHIIDAAALGKMRPTATLVNIARGGIVDELALADALANGRLAGAGLDVYEGEPAVRPELLALHNVVLTPHIGSASLATRRAMVQLAVDNLIAALGHGPNAGHPPSALNADAIAAAKRGGMVVDASKTDATKR